MKKILSLILAGLMTVSCAAFVAADDAAVEPANDAQTMVLEFLHEKDIWKGVDENEFVPDAGSPVQRYQMALLVSRISTGWLDDAQWMDDTANDSAFDDINEGAAAKFLGALSYANQNGIIEGVSATKFAPYAGITYRDALTMVVRTLGYKNLIYPWGYIEKAVELGLTEDVNVPYTQELTRGEVAQILYAALFADTKTGESLAKSIFGLDFGWKTIVITAADEGAFAIANGTTSKYVGFNLIDEDGKIGAKTYYTDKSELGMVNAHDDELALGCIYDVLFSIDNDLAVIEKAYKREPAVYKNIGITDNAGEAVATQPIKAYADKYSLVKDRTDKEYLTFLGKELNVYEKDTVVYVVGTNGNLVGVDVATNNILVRESETSAWTTKWYYNQTLKNWYEVKTVTDATDDIDFYLNWMTEGEFAEWYAKVTQVKAEKTQYTLKDTFSGTLDRPYAKLSAYNLDEDEADEIAYFKGYSIGYFTNSTVACGVKTSAADHSDTNKTYPSYKITSLDGTELLNVLVEAEHETTHEHVKNAYAWFNVDEDVTGFVTEDGKYNDGTILYNFDAATGEIDVIKYIPNSGEGMDKDSYWVSGILNGYSTEANKIYIDGVKIPYGYDKLSGVSNNISVGDNSVGARYKTAAYLDGMLMQYVKALVVDGKIVDIDLVGEGSKNDVIVVYGYAGVTSDGYIAVYGIDAVDGAMKIFKINSFNGWKKGDYRYYPENAKDDYAFERGTLYFIKSRDAETNSYGVETLNIAEFGADQETISIAYEGGYRLVWYGEDDVKVEDAKDSDLYVIITAGGRVYTTTGKQTDMSGEDMYFIEGGYKLYAKDGKFVIYVDDFDSVVNGFKLNGAGVGIYLYDRDDSTVLDAYYDDAQGVEDYYLLGATVSTIRAYNILTGSFDSLITTNNVDLDVNKVYVTIGNVIVAEWEYNGIANFDLVDRVAVDYQEDDIAYADYIALANNYKFSGADGIDRVAVATDLKKIAADLENETVIQNLANKVVPADKVIYKKVINVENKAGQIVGIDIDNFADNKLVATEIYTADAIYNVATKNLIVYIYDADTVAYGAMGTVTITPDSKWDIDADGDKDVELKISAAGKKVVEDHLCDETVVTDVTLDTLTLEFSIAAADHDEAAACGLAFGQANEKGKIKVTADVDVAEDATAKFTAVTCDNKCGLVNKVVISGLDLVIVEEVDDEVVVYEKDVTITTYDEVSGQELEIGLTISYNAEKDEVTITRADFVYAEVAEDWSTFVLGTTSIELCHCDD